MAKKVAKKTESKIKSGSMSKEEFDNLSAGDKVLYTSAHVLNESSNGNVDLAQIFFDDMQKPDEMANRSNGYVKMLRSQMGLLVATGHLVGGNDPVADEDLMRKEFILIGMHLASYICHLEARIRILESNLTKQ